MAFKLRSQGSSFKMMGSSPAKLWSAIGKEGGKKVVKQGIKSKIKKHIGKTIAAGTGAYYTGKDYKEKKKTTHKDKSVGRTVADAIWDNTIGFGTDVIDVVGESTGWYNPKSPKYPWGDGSRKNWSESAWADEGYEYDSRSGSYKDPETGHWHDAESGEITIENKGEDPSTPRKILSVTPENLLPKRSITNTRPNVT